MTCTSTTAGCRCRCEVYSLTLFFFNDTATTEIYTLSLHDALPICVPFAPAWTGSIGAEYRERLRAAGEAYVSLAYQYSGRYQRDRKSTRLNSSHANISYAVFCLKKKKRSS